MLLNFDYDGVIANSFDQLLGLAIRGQRSLGKGRPPIAEDFQKIESLTFEDLGRRIGLPEDQIPRFENRLFQLQQEPTKVEVFPGMVPLLEELSATHTVVVVTSSQSQSVAAALESIGLGRAVASVRGGERGSTKAERIEQARREYSFRAQDTFMIGDAVSDIRQGKLAGVRTIAVSWGYQDRDLLEKENPECTCDCPDELREFIKQTQ